MWGKLKIGASWHSSAIVSHRSSARTSVWQHTSHPALPAPALPAPALPSFPMAPHAPSMCGPEDQMNLWQLNINNSIRACLQHLLNEVLKWVKITPTHTHTSHTQIHVTYTHVAAPKNILYLEVVSLRKIHKINGKKRWGNQKSVRGEEKVWEKVSLIP